MNIKGKKVLLRAIEKSDLKLIHQWSNDPDINYMLGGWHFPSSMQDQERWYESFSLNSVNQRFAVEAEGFGLIGIANIIEINWKDRNATYGVLLGDKDIRGKGLGTDITMTVQRYVFEELNLKRLNGNFISYNEKSLHVHMEKCGWKIDGVRKNGYFRKNQWWDQIVAGVSREDYFALVERTNYWNEK
jgi:RimJ/RimL family protein N-acetyltransferase